MQIIQWIIISGVFNGLMSGWVLVHKSGSLVKKIFFFFFLLCCWNLYGTTKTHHDNQHTWRQQKHAKPVS
jgi:hypothetical protein